MKFAINLRWLTLHFAINVRWVEVLVNAFRNLADFEVALSREGFRVVDL